MSEQTELEKSSAFALQSLRAAGLEIVLGLIALAQQWHERKAVR